MWIMNISQYEYVGLEANISQYEYVGLEARNWKFSDSLI